MESGFVSFRLVLRPAVAGIKSDGGERVFRRPGGRASDGTSLSPRLAAVARSAARQAASRRSALGEVEGGTASRIGRTDRGESTDEE